MPISFNSQSLALKLSGLSNKTQSQLGNVYDQLSSGLRINRPGADSAGQAVASGLGVSARVANRARMNINDGISYLQIADGTLSSGADIIARMQELAAQSASGSLSTTQRSALATEFNQLSSELIRLKGATRFNNTQILNGAPGTSSASQLTTATSGIRRMSSDGRYLTYSDGTGALIQKDLLTGTQTQITGNISVEEGVAFDTDATGSIVVYTTDSQELYKYDRLTGQNTLLAAADNPIVQVAVSADGSRVAGLSDHVWDEDGTSIGIVDIWQHLFTVDLSTGVLKGDNALNPYEPSTVQTISLSANGDYIGVLGESFAYGTDTVVYAADVNLHEIVNRVARGMTNDIAVGNDAILYYLSSDNLGGVNPGGKINLVAYDGLSWQNLTNSSVDIQKFWATDFGTSFTFITAGNLTGENATNVNQAFKYSGGSIAQLTSAGLGGYAVSAIQSVSGDGQTLIATTGSGTFAVDARRQTNLVIGTGTGASGVIANGVLALDAAIRGLSDLDISTVRGAQVALDSFKMNERNLALARASLGAGLSRLESASRFTESKALVLTEARSKITDIDVAEGIAASTRLAILGDMQTAIFAQAVKLQPKIALQLLGVS